MDARLLLTTVLFYLAVGSGLILFLFQSCSATPTTECARYPLMSSQQMQHMMSSDNGFEVKLFEVGTRRKAYRFASSKVYEVVIRNRLVNVHFRDFYLTAVKKGANMSAEAKSVMGEFLQPKNTQRGEVAALYEHVDLVACPGVVRAATTSQGMGGSFAQVRLLWMAPKMPTSCVEFRATVVQNVRAITKDVGGLTLSVCPEVMYSMKKNGDVSKDERMTMPMMMPCCACGTATYRMTFESQWTKQLHPRDWPKDSGLLHWTNLVGASHDAKYSIYQEGGLASQAVQSICAYGDSTVLDQEFQTKGLGHLKNLIKVRGMWGEEEMNQNRSSTFSLNHTHHLLSFLTMMGPSTDWCTGVSSFDLCQRNCTWAKHVTVNLAPWDAGIKEGNTYIPKNADRKDIPDPIRTITDTWPEGNPFEPGRPVARLHLERISPVEDWQCPKKALDSVMEVKWDEETLRRSKQRGSGGQLLKNRQGEQAPSPLEDQALAQMATFLCITSDWTPWTACSVTCGMGHSMRERVMNVNKKNELCRHVPLKEVQSCEGRKRTCDYSQQCSLLPWSEWSMCNATCTQPKGMQTRTRLFAREEETSKCTMTHPDILLEEHQMCEKTVEDCDAIAICGEGRRDGFPCGNALTRYYYSASDHQCHAFTFLGCKGSRNNFADKMSCEDTCLEAVARLPQWRKEKMALLQLRTSSMDSSKKPGSGKSKVKMSKQCKEEVDPGRACQNDEKQISSASVWYYDYRLQRCMSFLYLGCDGNQNRFTTYKACLKVCKPDEFMNMQMSSEDENATMMGGMGLKINCVLSKWGPWGPCSQLCGGVQARWRRILKLPVNGGEPCGLLHEERICDSGDCVPCEYSDWSEWTECSKSCGIGLSKSRRHLLPHQDGCTPLYPHEMKTQLCNLQGCPM